ncbi:hypothetical protein ACWEN3_21190 [Streptomyces sp. NPDC004561]
MTRLTGRALRVTISIVDTEERVRAFPPQPDEPAGQGPVVLDDCEVVLPQAQLRSTGGTPTVGREEKA